MLARLLRRAFDCSFLGACLLLGSRAAAQVSPPPSFEVERHFDPGVARNTGERAAAVISFPVRVPGATWLRLHFREIDLPESGARLQVTSVQDGAQQRMTAAHCREWKGSTAYFNGDDVQVEVVAEPQSGPCRVVLARVVAGVPGLPELTQCGPTDDRVLSSDPRAGRALPLGCSVWLIDDCSHCFLTAGHCAASVDTVQFNVPLSGPTGGLNNPPPEDQYTVDAASVQSMAGLVGNDWSYFGCLPNTNTGLRPFQAQHVAYEIASAPPASPAVTLRITGYGTDSGTHNQVQQTSTGTYSQLNGTTVEHRVDTEGGNSGSAIEWEEQSVAIGIHTHGGCTGGGGSNAGTAIQNAFLQTALSAPLGLCVCHGEASTYCTGKVNSLGCTETIGSSGIPSAAGVGSFTITASNILNRKTGLLIYGYAHDETPWQGGTLCMAAPIKRTPGQFSGGSATGNDCTGTFSYDMQARIVSGADPNLTVGATVYCQYYSRDPGSSPPIGVTNAVQFTIGP